jgi:hypothetical protein
MLKSLVLASVLALVAAPAFADQNSCSAPIPPELHNLTTLKQVSDGAHYTNQFIKDSDDYQSCLTSELRIARNQAAKDKKDFDAGPYQIKMDENQKLKERVGTEFHQVFVTFCKANPTADPACAKLQ